MTGHNFYSLCFRTHTGTVSTLAFQIGIICLSSTKMDEKHKGMYRLL